ncbi:MATE family efflux transporter [Sphingomonas spermidinifaciens]|uniref:MATE family efflux transporter n=1 Tax=Sphingomonas spermidinifaciens TaxID=1141889 RepID=A0A2A4B3I6_9SPHN|nr:MATE family efflux transporter [Sphingomonas spermidinifaciens]PCD02607.1 MATE family efflux transporter [Sphingomonas spermidinifaciens]
MPAPSLTRRAILAQAWPIMLGQATVPLVGIVDTAVIGRTGDATALAAVALGTTIVNFLFWAFGFLRMGMTGLTAQASGAGDGAEMAALLRRGLILGGAVGAALFVLQLAIVPAALALMAGGGSLDQATRAYVTARLFGAPAALAFYAANGWLLGLGRTRAALGIQLILNLANVALTTWFVWALGWGVRGVGLATAAADWIAVVAALGVTRSGWRGEAARLFDRAALARLFAVNRDLMIRTLALLALFAWFTNAGARLGAETLAAQQVLMQFVAVSAFVLDGFCFTAEARVGAAIGARDRAGMLRAVRLVGEFCLGTAAAFALTIAIGGEAFVALLTTSTQVRAVAAGLLPLVAIVPLIGTPAWLLDGVFIGATAGRALRNAALLSTAAYVATDLALRPLGASGVWLALLLGYAWRALALGLYWRGLLRRLSPSP